MNKSNANIAKNTVSLCSYSFSQLKPSHPTYTGNQRGICLRTPQLRTTPSPFWLTFGSKVGASPGWDGRGGTSHPVFGAPSSVASGGYTRPSSIVGGRMHDDTITGTSPLRCAVLAPVHACGSVACTGWQGGSRPTWTVSVGTSTARRRSKTVLR